jgi:hypothetical protein
MHLKAEIGRVFLLEIPISGRNLKRSFELVSQHLYCGLGTVICKLCYREGCASNEGSGGRGSFVFRRFGMVFYLLLEHTIILWWF